MGGAAQDGVAEGKNPPPEVVISDDTWAEIVCEFLLLREERRGGAAMLERAHACRELAAAARDLAFEMKYIIARRVGTNGATHIQPFLESFGAKRVGLFRGDVPQMSGVMIVDAIWRCNAVKQILEQHVPGGLASEPADPERVEGFGLAMRRIADVFEVEADKRAAGQAKRVRDGHPNDGGRLPHVECVRLLERRVELGIGFRKLAERLAADGIAPDAEDGTPFNPEAANDPHARAEMAAIWESRLKQLDQRLRRKQAQQSPE